MYNDGHVTRGGIVLFPHTVIEQFTDDQVNTWHTHFADNGAHERSRRIEDDNGCRRIVHCRYQYGGSFRSSSAHRSGTGRHAGRGQSRPRR
ncbi:hypothetical protein [Streptomyces sp. NPDC002122]|uniref:hypothetical protein n=1 Tax=Streptomyces sp. NPDC002122 TaxID=3154407 RepID=UPI003331C2DD